MFTAEKLMRVEKKFKEKSMEIIKGTFRGVLPNDFQRDQLHTLLVRKANKLLFIEGITGIYPVIVITVDHAKNSLDITLRWRGIS